MRPPADPLFRGLAAAFLLGITLPVTASATTYQWTGADPSTPTVWDTSSLNWDNADEAGTTNTAWVNVTSTASPVVNSNDAVIAGTTITNVSNVRVRNITNNTANSSISGGTLTLDSSSTTGTNASNLGPVIATFNGTTLTINSVLTGTKGAGFNISNTNYGGTVILNTPATYTGNTLISLGTLEMGAANVLPSTTDLVTFGSGRTLELKGFSQTVRSIQGTNGIIKNTAGNPTATFTIDGSNSLSGGQQITGAINLVKKGTGTQTLTANNGALNYTGTTTISGGVLRLNSTTATTASLVNTSQITLDGGTLASTTSQASNLNLGGNVTMSAGGIQPGEAGTIASFTLAANKSLVTTGGTFTLDIDTTSSLDQILGSGTGTFSLTNTTLAINLLTWSDLDYASTYTLFSGFGGGGSVSNLTVTLTGAASATNYTASLNNAGVLSFTPVPEPSAALLLALGTLALAGTRRRRLLPERTGDS
jgi:fibronectin-binding autotransporter adhesin